MRRMATFAHLTVLFSLPSLPFRARFELLGVLKLLGGIETHLFSKKHPEEEVSFSAPSRDEMSSVV